MNEEMIDSYINGNINIVLNYVENLTPLNAAIFTLELADALVKDCALGSMDVVQLLKRRLENRKCL